MRLGLEKQTLVIILNVQTLLEIVIHQIRYSLLYSYMITFDGKITHIYLRRFIQLLNLFSLSRKKEGEGEREGERKPRNSA